MDLVSGELYFIGEYDPQIKSNTSYYKIGIVKKDDRTSDLRLKEHQTGNPRRLWVHTVIDSPAVEALETLLHGLYSKVGVGGEWYEFTALELEDCIDHAKSLVKELEENVQALDEARTWQDLVSNGRSAEPSKEILRWHEKYLEAKFVEKKCKELNKFYSEFLRIARLNDAPTGNLAEFSSRETRIFDVKNFALDNAEIYEKFLVQTAKLSGSFRATFPKSYEPKNIEFAPNFIEFFEKFKNAIPRDISDSWSNEELDDLFRESQASAKLAGWYLEIASAQIKNYCRDNDEIKGICKWSRTIKQSEKFDEKKFKENYPELFEKYLQVDEISVVLKQTRERYRDDVPEE